MIKRILLINSDLAKNRGDRAIAEGNIQLIKQYFPDAHISGISEHPIRDKDWFGIDFINMDFQSLSPFKLLQLCMIAKKSDLILWGGGEILKDYTNKAALWYWVIKITSLSIANPQLYGVYHGIGPTKSNFSKRLIVFLVNRSKGFIVRDKESYDKLRAWGASKQTLYFASDPAVLPSPKPLSKELGKKMKSDYNIDQSFLNDFICIGPRDWFHYKPGGILPFRYKKRLYGLFGKTINTDTEDHALYLKQLGRMISELTEKHHLHVLLVPMHMSESDDEICRLLRDRSSDPAMVRILNKDSLSPNELRSLIAKARAMIGFRLHSNIIGISAGVPSINIYYVDKGRVFFDQINQSHFALPIETVLTADFSSNILKLFDEIITNQKEIRSDIAKATTQLRESVITAFDEVFDDQKT